MITLTNNKKREENKKMKNTTQKIKSGTYYIKGGKWWDKVNGNTYFTAYVLDENNNTVLKVPFEYGYGSMYYYEAKKQLLSMARKNAKIKVVDGGADYHKKAEIKNYCY